MELPKVMSVAALAAAGILLAAGCGGTLEGKYRRGQLTTTTSRPARAPETTSTTGSTSTTTSTTVPTAGNAAGQRAQGEPKPFQGGGTIVESADWRSVVRPLGGRQR